VQFAPLIGGRDSAASQRFRFPGLLSDARFRVEGIALIDPEPVMLSLRCPMCHGAVHLTYQPKPDRSQHKDFYVCPHCGKTIWVAVPGSILPPVKQGHRI
jgi:hypothetical protein